MSIAREIATWLASTTQKGPVELATQAEMDAGTDTERAVTPAVLRGTVLPGMLIEEEVFTSSGTWTKPTGCRRVEVIAIGAGGGSAGAGVGTTPRFRVAGGGGGGGAVKCAFLASNLNSTETVTVGTGGAGGAAGNNAGSSGGDSWFKASSGGTYAKGAGGGGGAAAAADSVATGGTGGAGTAAGYISNTYMRMYGGTARAGNVGLTYRQMPGGQGGFAYGGVYYASACNEGGSSIAVTGVGSTAYSWGNGAAGAVVRDVVANRAGATGSAGIVIVRSYG